MATSRGRELLLALGIAALALPAGRGGSQTPLGGEILLNEHTIGQQLWPTAAMGESGSFVVVWHGAPSDGSDTAVFARLFDEGGAPRGGQFQVNEATLGRQEYGDVAAARDGSFVVVWQTRAGDYADYALSGRRFRADGTPLGPEFTVNNESGTMGHPRVEIGADGGFMVVWMRFPDEDDDPDGENVSDIRGRAFDASAQPLGPEFQVNTFTPRGQYSPELAAAPEGGFLAVWEGYSGVPPGFRRVFGRRFGASGKALGDELTVSSEEIEHSIQPTVAADGRGFTVVWTSWEGMELDIVSRRLDEAGSPRGPEMVVNAYTTGTQAAPAVAADAVGNVVFAWGSNGQDGDDTGVYARYLDCHQEPLGGELQVNTYTTGFQGGARVAAAGGDFVVVWQSHYGQDGSANGVFGRRFRGATDCGHFFALPPCRLVDTRQPEGPGGGPPLAANSTRELTLAGSCGVPADARAVAVNVTTLQQTHAGNLRLHPAGAPAPLASTINFEAGRTRANNALARLGAGGTLAVRCDMPGAAAGSTHLLLDVFGYFK
jgi:large repetitive protein